MLTVLGGLAEFERHLILSRTNEGRVRAKARGVRFGRNPSSLSINKPKLGEGCPGRDADRDRKVLRYLQSHDD